MIVAVFTVRTVPPAHLRELTAGASLVTNFPLVATCPTFLYRGDGAIVDGNGKVLRQWSADKPTTRNRAVWAAWYLHRDRVMLQHVTRRFREGRDVIVYVFTAGRSDDARVTLERAKHAKLPTAECEYTR